MSAIIKPSLAEPQKKHGLSRKWTLA